MDAKEIRDLLEMTKCRIESLMSLLDNGKVIEHEYERVLHLVTCLRAYLEREEVRRFFEAGEAEGETSTEYRFSRRHKVAVRSRPERTGRVIYASYLGRECKRVVVKWEDDGSVEAFDEPDKKIMNMD